MSKTNSMCLRVKHHYQLMYLLLCRVILQLLHFTLELYREEEQIKSIIIYFKRSFGEAEELHIRNGETGKKYNVEIGNGEK